MNLNTYKYLILSDLYRYGGARGKISFFKFFYTGEGFTYTFWMRTATYTRNHKVLKYFCYPIVKIFLSHYSYKLGISIPRTTKIDSGLYIGHYGTIIINENSIIGKNCNISQGVTIGQTNRGNRKGTPVIGNNVYIGPGAKIIGNIKIGNNVAIGANCVVTKDIPNNATVVGIPGKVISLLGSMGYVNFIDYDEKNILGA